MKRSISANLTPEQRRANARLAAHALHASHDTAAFVQPAVLASQVTRFEQQVDPERVLDPEERLKRVKQARKAYMLQLSLASSKARAQRKAAVQSPK